MPIDFHDTRVDSHQADEVGRYARALGHRMDAGETAFMARSFEYVKARNYDIKYGELKALRFVPLDTSVPEGAETVTVEQWDRRGMAKLIANYSQDLPTADAFRKEFSVKVNDFGTSYEWTLKDMRRVTMSGSPDFMVRKASAARAACDARIDNAGAFGTTEVNSTGITNDASVPIFAVPTAGAWTGLTAAQVLANMHAMAQAVVNQTNGIEEPDTMLLPLVEYGHVATTPYSATNPTTILEVFLSSSPYIKTVEQWSQLNTAGAAGAPRAITYRRSDDALDMAVPVLYQEQPPERRALAWSVPAICRIGTVRFYRQLSAVYSDLV